MITLYLFSPDPTFLTCEKGDLIILESDEKSMRIPSVGWYYGENYRTKESGDFPADIVYILPIITFPPPNILALFSDKTFGDVCDSGTKKDLREKQHTLEAFSKIYFR